MMSRTLKSVVLFYTLKLDYCLHWHCIIFHFFRFLHTSNAVCFEQHDVSWHTHVSLHRHSGCNACLGQRQGFVVRLESAVHTNMSFVFFQERVEADHVGLVDVSLVAWDFPNFHPEDKCIFPALSLDCFQTNPIHLSTESNLSHQKKCRHHQYHIDFLCCKNEQLTHPLFVGCVGRKYLMHPLEWSVGRAPLRFCQPLYWLVLCQQIHLCQGK